MAAQRRIPDVLPIVPTLVDLLRGGTEEEKEKAGMSLVLGCSSEATDEAGKSALLAAVAAADGIPALVALAGSHRDHLNIGVAVCCTLSELAADSPAHCRAIVAADGVAPLVGCLESSAADNVQSIAASALSNLALEQAGAAAVAAGSAIPVAVRCLGGSSHESLLTNSAALLANLAGSPEHRDAIAAAGGIPPLVRLLRHSSPAAAA